jgi:hypothetical protein
LDNRAGSSDAYFDLELMLMPGPVPKPSALLPLWLRVQPLLGCIVFVTFLTIKAIRAVRRRNEGARGREHG